MQQTRKARLFPFPAVAALAALILGLVSASPVTAGEGDPMTFDTAEAAVEAFLERLEAGDLDALVEIFGQRYRDELVGPDVLATSEELRQLAVVARKMNNIRKIEDGTAILVIGDKAWPFPLPLVADGGKWRFDTEAGLEEILNRRIGRDELNAIEVARAFVWAQIDYHARDLDGDGVTEFAQKFRSTPGEKDGLYWESGEGEDLSPFGPLIADSRAYIVGRQPGDPYQGYYFRVLTRQGGNVPGGRYDYVINGNMIAGFAMAAFPAEYGNSGIMTFVVNQQGKVYEKDLGEDTVAVGRTMEVYGPDETWSLVEE